ncbi:hypothetical protein [Litorilituus lipolyticus]|uniref:Lipoprotein n=1 Tax=Litorilituus lipolyticus TaxID=2491017 RepID=A0A502L7U6_9GAMM|nr:hypothetical protein [Litorilituus lipolyticus]TPH16437.1 hypothetical protein EPA86_06780 [Litorilituus lipolyticus]
MQYKYPILSAIMALSLTGCGGSSSSDNTPPAQTPDNNTILHIEDTFKINQSAELFLYYPNEEITNINWQQTSGSPVTFLAKNSKAISFTPKTSGDYQFTVNFLVNGISQNLDKTITVLEENSDITARLAHTVTMENKVSLRVATTNDVAHDSISWQQTAGPTVSFTHDDNSGNYAIFFDAPTVNEDTLITFEATASSDNGTFTDKVAVLVEPAQAITNNAYFDSRVAHVFPYNDNSPYASDIVDCVYSNKLTSSCTLSKLPLIAQETLGSSQTPDIDDIMDRVVVSHHWMGDRFKHFIENFDENNDFKHLLRATTAIVISYDVRPSFYWAATGAIYLDPENFWITPEERDTINEAPDFRSNFGKDLQFVMPWRYVKDNNYASLYFSKNNRVTRTEHDGLYRLTSLMYHELAHANDFFPSNEWFIHSSGSRVLDAATSSNFESDKLSITHPLHSQEMRNLAQVSFKGETASTSQKAYLPNDIKSFFEADEATDYYAYSSLREDYAMLFEELMMQSRYRVFRDVAITNQPTGSNVSGADYIVTWGQRGRIGEAKLKQRVFFSASRVLPEFDSNTALNNVPAPIQMIVGDNWIENLTISSQQTNFANMLLQTSSAANEHLNRSNHPMANNDTQRYYQKALPSH